MNRRQPFDRLQFDQQFALDHNVGAKTAVDGQVFKAYRDELLPFDTESTRLKRMSKNRLVGRLEHPRTERLMDVHAAIDRNAGDPVDFRPDLLAFLA